jgi:hypothetical protein
MNCIRDLAKVVVWLAWMVSVPVSAWASSGYIYDAAGSVTIAAGKSAPRAAVVNDTVTAGMVIRTGGESHAVLKFEDGEVVSLQSNTSFLVREYIYNPQQVEKSNIVFSMLKGGMRFVTGLIGRSNPQAFRLATPSATIGIRGTDFFAVMANDALYNKVSSGIITVTNQAGMSVFTAGNTALTSSPTALPVSIPPVGVPAETFSQIEAIQVPPAEPGAIPPPPPVVTAAPVAPVAAVIAPVPVALASTGTTAGGAAAGGAAAATTVATAGGISGGMISMGIGVAVGVALIANTTSTTHH